MTELDLEEAISSLGNDGWEYHTLPLDNPYGYLRKLLSNSIKPTNLLDLAEVSTSVFAVLEEALTPTLYRQVRTTLFLAGFKVVANPDLPVLTIRIKV